jgi:hypothetical protein
MKRSKIHCQFCVRSKLEVNMITMELKSALKLIEILKEELDFVSLLPNANKIPNEIVELNLKYL